MQVLCKKKRKKKVKFFFFLGRSFERIRALVPFFSGCGQKLVLQAWDTAGLRWTAQPVEGFSSARHWTALACTPPPHVTVHCGEQSNKERIIDTVNLLCATHSLPPLVYITKVEILLIPETKETSAILAEVEGGLDSSDDASSIGSALIALCGQGIQPGCRASEALLWVWEHGGTSWEQALCIFLQCPLL